VSETPPGELRPRSTGRPIGALFAQSGSLFHSPSCSPKFWPKVPTQQPHSERNWRAPAPVGGAQRCRKCSGRPGPDDCLRASGAVQLIGELIESCCGDLFAFVWVWRGPRAPLNEATRSNRGAECCGSALGLPLGPAFSTVDCVRDDKKLFISSRQVGQVGKLAKSAS